MSSTNFGPILIFASCVVGTCNLFIHLPGTPRRQEEANRTYIQVYTEYKITVCCRDSARSFFSYGPKYAVRGTGILGQIASFERRPRGAAPTPLALPCPFRTST